MNTLEQVKALIGDKAGIPAADVQDDAWLGSARSPMTNGTQHLDLDSADCLEVTMALEEHFGIEISDAQAEQAEMGTPAGIAGYVDKMLTGEYAAGIIHEPGTNGTPVESVADTDDVLSRQLGLDASAWVAELYRGLPDMRDGEFERSALASLFKAAIQSGYDAARPLNPATLYVEAADDTAIPSLRMHPSGGATNAPPISREELMRRGLTSDLDGAIMDIVMKLGFPTEDNPMGTEATHMLIPLDPRATEEEATEVLSYRNWVKFLRIERVEPMEQIHFDHPAAETPDWLIEACSLPSGDAGAVWAENGVLFASTPAGHVPVKPGQIINHSLVSQLQIMDDALIEPRFLQTEEGEG